MKRRKPRHAFPNQTPEKNQTPRSFGMASLSQRLIGSRLFKNTELIFWLVFLCVPVVTGWLDYQSLPGEFYNSERHELLKSHVNEAWPEGLGTYTVPDSWRDEATGTIYSADSFSAHHRSEARRLGIGWFAYGLIGCAFFAHGRGMKGRGAFFRAFRNSVILNAVVALFIFWIT